MSGTTSGKLRIRAVAQRMARGESGVTLVEMMVSLFIFAIVSTMFTTAIVQYLHSTSADAIRSRSSTEIATSVQSLDRYVRYAEGCRECSNTGYHGRVAIQQVMGVDTQMEDLIARGATSLEIEQAAKSKGMTSLREDGWQKVLQGITSVDEVLRVTV